MFFHANDHIVSFNRIREGQSGGSRSAPSFFASRSHVACGLLVSGRGRSGAPLLPCGSKDALALGAISLPGLVAGKWGLHK